MPNRATDLQSLCSARIRTETGYHLRNAGHRSPVVSLNPIPWSSLEASFITLFTMKLNKNGEIWHRTPLVVSNEEDGLSYSFMWLTVCHKTNEVTRNITLMKMIWMNQKGWQMIVLSLSETASQEKIPIFTSWNRRFCGFDSTIFRLCSAFYRISSSLPHRFTGPWHFSSSQIFLFFSHDFSAGFSNSLKVVSFTQYYMVSSTNLPDFESNEPDVPTDGCLKFQTYGCWGSLIDHTFSGWINFNGILLIWIGQDWACRT